MDKFSRFHSSIYQNTISTLILPLASLILIVSCTNSGQSLTSFPINPNPSPTPSNNGPVLVISNVTIAAPSQNGNSLTTFFFNSAISDKINESCAVGQSLVGEPCNCRFKWEESNAATGTVITRVVTTPLLSSLDFIATCNAPAVYNTEIPNQTKIMTSIVPVASVSSLSIEPFEFQKGGPGDTSGDFLGLDGNPFVNILRYSCYERSFIGRLVRSGIGTAQNGNRGTGQQKIALANRFCIDGISNGDNCPTSGNSESQQSYYFDAYLPSDENGGFISSNSRFECPEVTEVLNPAFSVGGRSPYPFDTTFALSERPTPTFSLGVEALSKLGLASNQFSGPTTCAGQFPPPGQQPAQAVAGTGNEISRRCIGFAAPPTPSGSCPTTEIIEGANVVVINTYRLRRFYAQYPTQFRPDGTPIPQAIATNEIYVVDRPVTSGNPLTQYSMLGPKPCNFAYLDRAGTLNIDPNGSNNAVNFSTYNGGMPAYRGTNHVADPNFFPNNDSDGLLTDGDWNLKNVNGTKFPNLDNPAVDSCSTLFPLVNYDSVTGDPTLVTLGTSNLPTSTAFIQLSRSKTIPLGQVYVRPQLAWAPFYVEDKSFKACVPLAKPFIDAPLHFAKDAQGQVAYCAETYPTQNTEISELDKSIDAEAQVDPVGFLQAYTSHAVKNSNSPACAATIPTIPDKYPAPDPGAAPTCKQQGNGNVSTFNALRHPAGLRIDRKGPNAADNLCANESCDRTVAPLTSSSTFPLLAPARDVERMLFNDPSYRCTVTWDNGGAKSGVLTPASGCCGPGVLTNLATGGSATFEPQNSAHLEPGPGITPACTPPTY